MISVSDAASLTNKKLNLVVFSSSFIESTNGKRGAGWPSDQGTGLTI